MMMARTAGVGNDDNATETDTTEWRFKYNEVQSQQTDGFHSKSIILSNNPKILNNYLIFTMVITPTM